MKPLKLILSVGFTLLFVLASIQTFIPAQARFQVETPTESATALLETPVTPIPSETPSEAAIETETLGPPTAEEAATELPTEEITAPLKC